MIVQGVKTDRGKEGWFYRVCAGFFYSLISKLTRIDFRRSSDFKLLDRKIVDIVIALPEKTRFFRALSVYYGFTQVDLEFTVDPRRHGVTNWHLTGLVRYAADSISSYTAFPLQMIMGIGAVMLLLFSILGCQTLYHYCMGRAAEGFTTVILLLLLIAGALFTALGIIGYYMAKIYEEVKARPSYVVEKEVGQARLP